MKRIYFCLLLMMASVGAFAQKQTTVPMLYKSFKPSVITLSTGRKVRQSHTNVYLKNSVLLYLKGEYTMEAEMKNILAVDFEDRHFININNQLAYMVDSVGGNVLYCVELFDREAFERNLQNNVNISNMDIGEMINIGTLDINNEEDWKLPVFKHFYFFWKGEYVKVHERDILRKLNKEQRVMFKRMVALPDFSWQSEKSLMQLLKAITQ